MGPDLTPTRGPRVMRGDYDESGTAVRLTLTQWDAAASMLAELEDYDNDHRSSRQSRRDDWAHATVDEARSLVTDGWAAEVGNLRVEPNVRVEDVPRPTLQWDVGGSDVDVAAYLGGNPEHMGEYVDLPRPLPLVRIGIDRTTHSGIPTSQLLAAGRSVLLVVESLRARGYPVEVWACIAGRPVTRTVSGRPIPWKAVDGRILIQPANQPVHVARLAFWAAHPAAFRRIWFSILEDCLSDDARKAFGAWVGYEPYAGYTVPIPDWAKPDFDEWAPSGNGNVAQVDAWAAEVLGRRV